MTVLHGDGAEMPFDDASFTGAVSFTMLHHIASASLHDRLFREVFLVLAPCGVFAGTDCFRKPHAGGGNRTHTRVAPDEILNPLLKKRARSRVPNDKIDKLVES